MSQQIELIPFNLTSEQGAQIAIAIIGVWAIGWIFKQIARVIRET